MLGVHKKVQVTSRSARNLTLDVRFEKKMKLAQVRQFGLQIRKIKPVQPAAGSESFENWGLMSVSRPPMGM